MFITNNKHRSHTTIKTPFQYAMRLYSTHTCMWYHTTTIDANRTSKYENTSSLTNHLCKSTPRLLHFTYDSIWSWCMDIQQGPDNAQYQHNKCKSTHPLLQITNVKVHLQLHWLSQQQLHYQVYMSTHSTFTIHIRVIITHININLPNMITIPFTFHKPSETA
jgi:hypothetical protein